LIPETSRKGDQLFTDVLAGNRLGIFTILVEPLVDPVKGSDRILSPSPKPQKPGFFTKISVVMQKCRRNPVSLLVGDRSATLHQLLSSHLSRNAVNPAQY
jgi:hypothetical protein